MQISEIFPGRIPKGICETMQYTEKSKYGSVETKLCFGSVTENMNSPRTFVEFFKVCPQI
jgi:hypothetical protein